jgi:hypothetical protein
MGAGLWAALGEGNVLGKDRRVAVFEQVGRNKVRTVKRSLVTYKCAKCKPENVGRLQR